MVKVEVQVRSCFCCGLTLGSMFIALYTLLFYSLLTGLVAWGISDTATNGDSSYYTSCELKAQGKIPDNRKLTFHPGGLTTVVVEDSTSYHCSFGLYTEEIKYDNSIRYSVLLFDLFLYVLLIFASVILLVGLMSYTHWLLIPWIFLMIVDIIRGTISTCFIFVYSHGNLARIATGIFFLGLQFFHFSILIIIIAKCQRIYNRKRGVILDSNKQRHLPAYPTATLPSNYAYSPSQLRRDHVPPSSNYPYSEYSPSQKDSHIQPSPHRYYDGGYPPANAYQNRY